ncbi:MAG: hypothetical protein PHG07_10005 [Lachnospiraceae bacterium]|nr:hypothetical protein [Lachnospiraceae bacterium]
MQGKLKFETFLDAYRGEFDEYLSSSVVDVYATKRHKEIMDEQDILYKKYPKVRDVIDMGKTHELSEEECTALIKVYNLKNELLAIEMQDVYFKGCGDCVGYLKRMNLL